MTVRLPTVVLSRHGQPDWDHRTPIPGSSLVDWVQGRDDAPLESSSRPPEALMDIARSCRVIAASPLRRSFESAQLLAPGVPPDVRPQFRELSLPTLIRSRLRLPPTIWSALARAAWYGGWSPDVESLAAARVRAASAATMLAALAFAEGPVLLAGHGLMNGFIGTQLRRAGWQGPRHGTRRVWSFAVYEHVAG